MAGTCLIGHTADSLHQFPQGMGEIADTHSLSAHLSAAGIAHQTHDVFSLRETPRGERYILLTFPGELRRLQRSLPDAPQITRLYLEHEYSDPPLDIHQDSQLVLTRNLLAHTCGLPPEKMLYLPTLTLPGAVRPDPTYRQRMNIPEDALLMGCSTRFLFRKNVEFLLSCFPREGAILLLHGQLDPSDDLGEGEEHTPRLQAQLQALKDEPWLRWDSAHYPREQALALMSTFDAAVHLSGGEDVGNSVIEQLALGIPTLLLGGGNRPYLFRDMALLCETQGAAAMRQGARLFHVPDRDDLKAKLTQLIQNSSLRKTLRQRAPALAIQRFGDQITRDRLPLLLDPDPTTIRNCFEEDLQRFALTDWPH